MSEPNPPDEYAFNLAENEATRNFLIKWFTPARMLGITVRFLVGLRAKGLAWQKAANDAFCREPGHTRAACQ